ncbi:sugar phosphate nucleotidyltransferase [Schinkia azotoformans]|uniref:ADP-glucose pyrophosphorylase n=1 Tax=Schinkia azotoformans LMG 9581 TaxID=1131731 RepID=K6D2Z2_SCHAZ|nr:sugar phosphate nucleotidyltransferase [Schinkia azotoformans]EKN62418.1 ADP-glucose pyrophosphorylase [Schinkia azotoformans LMG 9581]MEC1640211.1 sugar phosphate nucleotidyltransferase [Schinkia azotoformans]MEC1720596.1 sugar phosphate nucleotidyltransferase [Schinkia azotoformans]MEC1945363.1 sugar phosphate nucleotidyltransferase [Schinkia azotoformans]MED4353948.1 sugar phosphate nucleotidyltransferase [Schinkia azotoformans]
MSNEMLGLIDATTSFGDLKELTMMRSSAAVPFGGRYRLIDFALSNMVNSGIQSVAIFPKYHYRSLMDHLGSGKDWDLNRKKDGLFFFPPPFNSQNDHLASVLHYIKYHKDYLYRSTQEYAVIAGSNTICNLDFNDVLNRHIETGADITEVCKNGEPLDMYILKKTLLLDILDAHHDESRYSRYGLCDVIEKFPQKLTCHSYEYDGYAVTINSITDYYRYSLELLQPEIMEHLFSPKRPIYTKVKDEPPTRYSKNAIVKNAQIANGCIIEGHIENSIIFRGVKVGKDAVIKNSIIMQKSQIGEGAVLEGVILDKDVTINDQVKMYGTAEAPVVIQKGSVQGALMNS